MKSISISEYFLKKDFPTLLDVRSPSEYEKGHIPSAENLPLFSDEERAEVGTLYKQNGPNIAMMKGLELAGSKLTEYIKDATALIEGKNVVVHCWRGGKRSSSMGTLLEFMGFNVELLKGGYKAYRNFILQEFKDRKIEFNILGGPTGSGKTRVLQSLEYQGAQIIDLERMASHRGSSFGALGQEVQPSTEQFENDLFAVFRKLDFSRPVWIENESRSIGKVYLPEGFWEQSIRGNLYEIDVPKDDRIANLIQEYGAFSKGELMDCLDKLSKRLGGQNVKAAKEAFEEGNLGLATSIALKYYDKAYAYAASKKPFSQIHQLKFTSLEPDLIAEELLAYSKAPTMM